MHISRVEELGCPWACSQELLLQLQRAPWSEHALLDHKLAWGDERCLAEEGFVSLVAKSLANKRAGEGFKAIVAVVNNDVVDAADFEQILVHHIQLFEQVVALLEVPHQEHTPSQLLVIVIGGYVPRRTKLQVVLFLLLDALFDHFGIEGLCLLFALQLLGYQVVNPDCSTSHSEQFGGS